MGVILHCLFSGPRGKADSLVGELAASGFRAAVDAAESGHPNTRFHKLGEPIMARDDGGVLLDEHGDPETITYAVTDGHGQPVWDQPKGEAMVEALVDDREFARAQEIARAQGFVLRMHGPSGFGSYEEGDAVAAGLYTPHTLDIARRNLAQIMRDDPDLAAEIRNQFVATRQ